MKKLLAVVLVVTLGILCTACGINVDSCEKNLGDDYKIKHLTDSKIEEYGDLFNIDIDKYNIQKAIDATHNDEGYTVMVFECKSNSDAEKLVEKMDYIVQALEEIYSSAYSFDAVNEGKCVLIGETRAIKDALNK